MLREKVKQRRKEEREINRIRGKREETMNRERQDENEGKKSTHLI